MDRPVDPFRQRYQECAAALGHFRIPTKERARGVMWDLACRADLEGRTRAPDGASDEVRKLIMLLTYRGLLRQDPDGTLVIAERLRLLPSK